MSSNARYRWPSASPEANVETTFGWRRLAATSDSRRNRWRNRASPAKRRVEQLQRHDSAVLTQRAVHLGHRAARNKRLNAIAPDDSAFGQLRSHASTHYRSGVRVDQPRLASARTQAPLLVPRPEGTRRVETRRTGEEARACRSGHAQRVEFRRFDEARYRPRQLPIEVTNASAWSVVSATYSAS